MESADVNHFLNFWWNEFFNLYIAENHLLHSDVNTILGFGLEKYTQEPKIKNNKLIWEEGPKKSLNESIIRKVSNPFQLKSGIRMMSGNIGRAIMKTSAVSSEHMNIEAELLFLKNKTI